MPDNEAGGHAWKGRDALLNPRGSTRQRLKKEAEEAAEEALSYHRGRLPGSSGSHAPSFHDAYSAHARAAAKLRAVGADRSRVARHEKDAAKFKAHVEERMAQAREIGKQARAASGEKKRALHVDALDKYKQAGSAAARKEAQEHIDALAAEHRRGLEKMAKDLGVPVASIRSKQTVYETWERGS